MVIVDASVVFKWFAEAEPEFQEALQILKDHQSNTSVVAAPELLIYELANAWATKTKINLELIRVDLEKLKEIAIQFENITIARIEKAVELANKYKISVYDASYIVLAQEKQCDLVTADAALVGKVNLPFVKLLG